MCCQIMGHSEAVHVMEQMDPLILLIGLPAVPIVLVLFKLIKWDEFLLNLWQKYSFKIPYLKKLFGADGEAYLFLRCYWPLLSI